MKLLIISDIHGSSYYAKKIQEIEKNEKPDRIIILGDLYYHGPRNELTQEYNPMEVAKVLNHLKEKMIVLRGNCDAEVDEAISEFPFYENYELELDHKQFFFTHGHKYNRGNIPNQTIDVLIYGHLHTGFIEKENRIIIANPGSISLPRENSKHSYLIYENDKLTLKDIDGTILNQRQI